MFKVNDQVVVRKKLANCTRVQIGSIVDIQGGAYTVRIPGEPRAKIVNEGDLAEVGSMFPGRKVVDHVAARRGNYKPFRQ